MATKGRGEAEEMGTSECEEQESQSITASASVIAHPASCSEPDDGSPPVMVSGQPPFNPANHRPKSTAAVTEQGKVYEDTQPHMKDGNTFTTQPRNVPSVTVRDDSGIGVATRQPTKPPAVPVDFKQVGGGGGQAQVDSSTIPDILELVKGNPGRSGIAFLCVSTGSPGEKDFIANCTAMEKMKVCLGEKLGYLPIPVGMNMTTHQLDILIGKIEKLKLPESYCRVIFYFFGHGNDDFVKLADDFVERQHIISKFQFICPPNSNVFKIFIFDSCRKTKPLTCEAVQESDDKKAALSGESWKVRGQYPESTNTLVINATDCNSKAYYHEANGCGLMTRFFAELAPTRNESLRDLLAAVRQEIAAHMETQILVYEDKLMGTVNLLAESQGTARIVPMGVSVSPAILSANVHWRFDDKVQKQIKSFDVEISSDAFPAQTHKNIPSLPSDRMASISGLVSGRQHSVKVVAVYKDGTRVKSETVQFITPVRDSPSHIEITPQYPGSPGARIMWFFAGESSDLASFHVLIQADGERPTYQELASGSRGTVVRGMLPLKTHQITVIAVYRDGVEKKGNVEFTHSDRSCPAADDINITPDFNGSPNATLTWSFTGAANDLSHFRVAVEAEGKGIVLDDSVTKDEKGTRLQNLQALMKHKVTVTAVYSDGIQKCSSVDFTHTDRCYPEEIEVMQDFPGSSMARVNWSFPEDISPELSDFILSFKVEGDDKVICLKNTAAVNRSDTLSNLKPGKRYTVAVAAHYKDGIEKTGEVEHENMDRSSPDDIKITQEIPGSTQAMVGWSFPENCNTALAQFFIAIKKEENGRVVYETPVALQERDVHIADLQPSTKYVVTVVAKYSDGILKESSKEYTNCDLKAASIQSTRLTRLREGSPPKAVFKIHWSYDHDEPLLEVDHFKLIATPLPADTESEGRLIAIPLPAGTEGEGRMTGTPLPADMEGEGICRVIHIPTCRSAKLELEPGTTYSLSVVTYFLGNIEPQKSKEDIKVTAPADEKVIPTFEIPKELTQQTSAIVTISNPPILQADYEGNRLQLTSIKYAKRKVPRDGDDGPNQVAQGTNSKFVDFRPDSNASITASPPPQPRHQIIDKLEPGRKYRIKLRANYNTGDSLETEEREFQTQPYTGWQKCCCCCCFNTVYVFILFVLVSSLFLISTFPVYIEMLKSDRDCATHYVLTLDSIQCGEVNSLRFSGIEIEGSLRTGDKLQGGMKTWLVHEKDLKLYSQPNPPVRDGAYVPHHTHLLLNGWQLYTWKNSVIFGYCCIWNNGTTKQTASLYMFRNDEDVQNFKDGEGPSNAILSDTITIPPSRQECFKKWGTGAPFTVTHSSYHFIVVDAPANTTFSSNITVMQTVVNTSDYGAPHYFRYDNSTHFKVSGHLFSQNKYITICKAPLYARTLHQRIVIDDGFTLASQVGSESLHIRSCNEPQAWMKPTFLTLFAIGLGGLFVSCLLCICTCICQCIYHRDRLINLRKCSRRRRDYNYAPLPSTIQ